MRSGSRPGVDRVITPAGGVTRGGQPLSYNRAPRPDLAPWVARYYFTKVDAPADHQLNCGIFNDTAMVRMQLRGNWKAETLSGPLEHSHAALFFGPQSRLMPISVTGSFLSVGISLRPGVSYALKGPKIGEHVDRIVTLDDIGMSSQQALSLFDPDIAAEDCITVMENWVHSLISNAGGKLPDPVSVRFENASFINPNISVAEFARDCDVDQRQLERIISRDFGMPPKQVLRRARALDMASHLRGVADAAEGEELALRYYDQSHLIRDFVELFGMSPNQFITRAQPILTLALESRQSRRLEAIERLAPGAVRPWQ